MSKTVKTIAPATPPACVILSAVMPGIKVLYEMYKIDWMRRISTQRQLDSYMNYFEECSESDTVEDISYEEYLEDTGYDGQLYVCFNEFCNHELQDEKYILELTGGNALLMECRQLYLELRKEEVA